MSQPAPPSPVRITAAILVIGDEILSGRTKDQNIGAIADHLIELGIDLKEVRIVGDEEAEIIAALNALRPRYTYVFTTGGIGPTHDDITADSVAKAFKIHIGRDSRAVALMEEYYAGRNISLTDARLRMARIPEGATLIRNSVSAAPGFMVENVIVMAGVPAIMRVMLDDATQYLRRGSKIESRTLEIPRPEGEIADLFRAHASEFQDVAMGSYPQRKDGRLSTQLVLRAADVERLESATTSLVTKLAAAGFVAKQP
jgi:molybdenum cofactor synthesis domain-containing protein